MAKKKGATEIITLQCEVCKHRNYTVIKNRKNNPDRLERSKYCSFDRKHTLHKEIKH
ncbi:MAG: 50S ribosomal protein L33 [Candidatus Makaraimicrobium thalassicum]|nr:MAG: 50S ribosomal protein L33 [Candidatus Omnitrophota bacterium]